MKTTTIYRRAIIYCRFSPRPNAEECTSNEKQEERCRAYCNRQNCEVVRSIRDDAVSGRILDRPGLNEAIEALTPGMVLVVDRSDRLARDMLVNLTIRHQIDKAGATIEFADGSPNGTTPEGKLFSNILAAFAAYERDRIAARTSAGLKRKQANGQHIGRAPVGYRVCPETKELVEHEGEQRAIASAVGMAAWRTSVEIAADLTRCYGPFRGKPWSARTVRKILARDK